MAIIQYVTEDEFVNGLRGDFSPEAARALFEHIDAGMWGDGNVEFDPIALRSQFSEYGSVEEAAVDLGADEMDVEDAIVVEFNGGIIIDSDIV